MGRFTREERLFIVVALSAIVLASAIKSWRQRARFPHAQVSRSAEISGPRHSKNGPVPDHD